MLKGKNGNIEGVWLDWRCENKAKNKRVKGIVKAVSQFVWMIERRIERGVWKHLKGVYFIFFCIIFLSFYIQLTTSLFLFNPLNFTSKLHYPKRVFKGRWMRWMLGVERLIFYFSTSILLQFLINHLHVPL